MTLSDVQRVAGMRGNLLRAVRRFFHEAGYLEVETPVRIPAPALEPHVDAERSGNRFLRTSPELHMKRLLAADFKRVFQIGPCFRRGERGRRHNPEFSLLEWYRAGADYMGMLDETRSLVLSVLRDTLGCEELFYGGRRINLSLDWDCLTVEMAFLAAAGWNPVAAFDEERFNLDLVGKVEPSFAPDRPTVLKDYPAALAALARYRTGAPETAERWELYIGGLEIANAFSELTDSAEQRARFEKCRRVRRKRGAEEYPIDEDFLSALEAGLPDCGGVALGIDRLVMLAAGVDSIEKVRLFCDSDGDGAR